MSIVLRDSQGRTSELAPGTYLVSRPKTHGPMTHYGVLFTGHGVHPDRVIDLQESGVREVSIAEFGAGLEVSVHRGRPPWEAHEVIRRAREMLQKRPEYSALGFNCQHLATYIVDGKAESGQAALVVVGVVVIAAVLLSRE